MSWQPYYPPPRPPSRGLTGGQVAGIIIGLLLLAFMVLVVVNRVRGGSRSKRSTSSADRDADRKREAKREEERDARAEELRDALRGKLPVKSTDATCQRFACTTLKGDEYGTIQRAASVDDSTRVRIIVGEKIAPSEVAEAGDWSALECSGGYVFTGGPLKNFAMLHVSGDTHLMSAGYMLPSTGHGYSAERVECVVAAFR